jgi:uncharacterized protein (DUF924 family)
MHDSDPAWVRETLEFWFSELNESDWWRKSDTVDATIRARFLGVHQGLAANDAAGVDGPRPVLAGVVVLDQFSRNMFRNTPRAFAADPLARRLARQAISQGFDAGLRPEERLFLYLPFEHSEDRADQAISVELISRLGRDDWTRHALAHQAIVDRFGRFPHRNAVLGRESTAEEVAALREPMSSF